MAYTTLIVSEWRHPVFKTKVLSILRKLVGHATSRDLS
jgi:hypothetical protein